MYAGSIELRAALKAVNASCTDHLAEAAFRLADTNHNGYISREEFVAVWRMSERRNAGEVMEWWLHTASVTGLSHMIGASAHRDDMTTIVASKVQRGEDLVKVVEAEEGHRESPKPGLLIAGALTGATQKTIMAPISRLIILRQVGPAGAASGGMIASLRRLVATEGIRGPWRGNLINVARVAPSAALNFTTFSVMQWLLVPKGQSLKEAGPLVNAVSGATSGMVAASATYPLDLLRTRLCTSPDPRASIRNLARHVYETDGVRGFYRGLGVTLSSVIPSFALNWMMYEKTKQLLGKAFYGKEEPGVLVVLASGVMAGTVSASVVYPLDVLRRRSQMAGNTKSPAVLARNTVAKFGVKGLYRGFGWYVAKSVPAAGISYTAFEVFKGLLDV